MGSPQGEIMYGAITVARCRGQTELVWHVQGTLPFQSSPAVPQSAVVQLDRHIRAAQGNANAALGNRSQDCVVAMRSESPLSGQCGRRFFGSRSPRRFLSAALGSGARGRSQVLSQPRQCPCPGAKNIVPDTLSRTDHTMPRFRKLRLRIWQCGEQHTSHRLVVTWRLEPRST
jgi:hypothetical protein